MDTKPKGKLVLAFDTANATIAVAVGRLDIEDRSIELLAAMSERAERASNTKLIPMVDGMFSAEGLDRADLACIAVGVGPGSFTGVRIAVATAKGIASALGLPLVGISTLGAIAQGAWAEGTRGTMLVVDDAMRKEVYPAFFSLGPEGVERLTPDRVVKADGFDAGEEVCDLVRRGAMEDGETLYVAGDGLGKHRDTVVDGLRSSAMRIEVLQKASWDPRGAGLLLELERSWREGDDILDFEAHGPEALLPVYTRLSDAEENERTRISDASPKDLVTGVQGEPVSDAGGGVPVRIEPFDASFTPAFEELESHAMGTDAWSAAMLGSDLSEKGRIWWMAVAGDRLVGYAGGLLAGDDLELLKVAVDPSYRRKGIGTELVGRLAEDARNLAATSVSLEVRASNSEAIGFYGRSGFREEGRRPGYYSDGEDAIIMRAPLDTLAPTGVAGLELSRASEEGACADGRLEKPVILAIESSCDETAAAVVDGARRIASDVVASQVDFHARFGGVVPEIASRKHIEAIAGVATLALEDASTGPLRWGDVDAIAVTYAPGLIGALVVGVAFSKGAAWALDVPLIAVNHLEGHLYANELDPGYSSPAVVSLLSGGNTLLVHMRSKGDYEVLGGTIDDAVGEAFDKVAKAMGLPYPGGPVISELAREGDPHAIDFPRALMHSGDYRFSLSGLKTAVRQYLDSAREAGEEVHLPDVCASFQQAVIEVQVEKARRALKETGASCLCIGGGVAANPALRDAYGTMCSEEGVTLSMPPISACGDNAAMIGLVAQDRYAEGRFEGYGLDAKAHADISEPY